MLVWINRIFFGLLLAGGLLCLLTALRERRPLLSEEGALPSGWPRVLLYGAAILLALTRLIAFGRIPGGFNQDGAMAAVDALALARYGTDRFGTWLPAHFTAWGFGQMSVLMSYCMVPLIWLFGLSAVTARLPILLASLAGLWGLWAFTRRFLHERGALIVLILAALCPWHFMQSRWALDCNLFPHMFVLGLALLYRGTEKKAALYGSMVFFALCMYSYGVAFYMVPIFLLLSCGLLLWEKRIRWGQALLCVLIYFGLSFPIYGTMFINALQLPTLSLPFVTMPYFPGSVRTNDMLFFSAHPGQQLLSNAQSLLRVALLQKPDLPWNEISGFGSLYRCASPLILLGLGVALWGCFREKREMRRLGYRLLCLYWLSSVLCGLCINGVNINRINIIFYSHLLFAAIGTEALFSWRRRSLIPLALGLAILSGCFFHSYFTSWAEQIDRSFYGDFLQAVTAAGEQERDCYYISPDTQYTGSRAVSEILTMYALQIDARYFQGQTPEGERPYTERYRYENPEPSALQGQESLALVLRQERLGEYDLTGWTLQSFGGYVLALSP